MGVTAYRRLVFQYDDEVLHPSKSKHKPPMDFWMATWFFDWLTSGSYRHVVHTRHWVSILLFPHSRWLRLDFFFIFSFREVCSEMGNRNLLAKFQGPVVASVFIGYDMEYEILFLYIRVEGGRCLRHWQSQTAPYHRAFAQSRSSWLSARAVEGRLSQSTGVCHRLKTKCC